MSSLFRIASFAMMFIVTAPMVRDCCLPLTTPPPCHQSSHRDDLTCASNLQAITKSKTANAFRLSVSFNDLPVALHSGLAVSPTPSQLCEQATAWLPPPIDLYLRAGVLLI